jgi:hypothetical protein
VTVIASAAKQSIAPQEEMKNGLLRRFAPRNDAETASNLPDVSP